MRKPSSRQLIIDFLCARGSAVGEHSAGIAREMSFD
jgi:hypothetical protein